MMDNENDYEVIADDMDDLVDIFRAIPEKNIAFAFTGRPFPFVVHVLRQKGRATVREMSYDVLKLDARGNRETGEADGGVRGSQPDGGQDNGPRLGVDAPTQA